MTDATLPSSTIAPLSRKRSQQRRWTVLLPVLGLITLATAGFILLGLGTSQIGALPVLVGAAAALLPVGPVIGAYLWIDRWEPEPAKILLLAFAWGACGASFTSLIFNQTALVLGELINNGSGTTFAALLGAPVTEEAAKAAFLIALFLVRRQEFDGIVDGIVYAGVTAAGFAFTENIYYFARVFSDSGFGNLSDGVIALFVLRGVLSPFAHPLFTTMTGIGIGIAVLATRKTTRVIVISAGYLLAVGLHSLWNFSATVGTGSTFINFYFLIMAPIFAGMVVLVVWQRRREQRVVTRQLPTMAVNRWIAVSEMPLLGSLANRKAWRKAVRRKYGDFASRAVLRYQVAATELAFLRHHIDKGTAGSNAAHRHEILLTILATTRKAAIAAPEDAKAAKLNSALVIDAKTRESEDNK